MYLPKLSNEDIGRYHTPAASARLGDNKIGERAQIEQPIEPAISQSNRAAILAQIAQLETFHAEFGSLCGQMRESIQRLTMDN
jgi:hypothetical protein